MHAKSTSWQDLAKQRVASAVVEMMKDGMSMGLGSGSTSMAVFPVLAQKIACGELRGITGLPTSDQTRRAAEEAGVKILNFDSCNELQFGFDGADFIDERGLIVKGGGAAHTIEKLVAERCRRWVVIADESKLVRRLGKDTWIPIEVIPEAKAAVIRELELRGAQVTDRETDPSCKRKALSDRGNPIIDARFFSVKSNLGERIKKLTGVVEQGLFNPDLASEILIARRDGSIESFKAHRSSTKHGRK